MSGQDSHMGEFPSPTVTIFGSSVPRPGSQACDDARAVGRALAELGYAVANGGYGGTMAASALGAKDTGGRTIGVNCDLWPQRQPPTCFDEILHTPDLEHRLAKLLELGSAGYVVLPGGTGTLAELAMVWELMCKKIMPPRPLVCFGPFWSPLIAMMVSERASSARHVQQVECAGQLERIFPRCDKT